MKTAYGILGFLFLIVFVGAYVVVNRAEAPTIEKASPKTTLKDNTTTMLTLTSPAFLHNESIPSKYTCDGENVSPPLAISGVPEGTESLVLLMDDPDIPDFVKEERGIEKFDHWVLYGIDPKTTDILEGAAVGSKGLSSRGSGGYTGPCPPDREHRYFFRLYALDTTINFIKAPTLGEVEAAIEGHVIEQAELIGLYERVQ